MHYLIVVRPFGSYRIGDIIAEDVEIDRILGTEHSTHVVRIIPPSEV